MVQLERRRFTVLEFDRMAGAGILREDDRLELVGGEIVAMSPIGDQHAACVDHLAEWLTLGLAGRAHVSVQTPLVLDDLSEVYPDIVVFRPRADRYRQPGQRRPENVLLLVEVSDTTLRYDQRVKVPLYARAGVEDVWLLDLPRRRALVYTDPTPDGYRTVQSVVRAGSLAPAAFPDLRIALPELLG